MPERRKTFAAVEKHLKFGLCVEKPSRLTVAHCRTAGFPAWRATRIEPVAALRSE
jgi:hypothetical protein